MKKSIVLAGCGLVVLILSGLMGACADLTTVAGNTNLAAAANGGRIVAFSSEALDENGKPIPEWQASNLIDGKYVVGSFTPADSYGWSSQRPPSDQEPEWIVLAFTEPNTGQDITRLISRIVIDPTTDDPLLIGRWIQGFTLQTSVTGPNGPWKTVMRRLVVNIPVKQTFDFPPSEARYVRLLITSNHGSDRTVEMGEVEIYEAIVPSEQLDELIIRLENLLNDLKRYRDGQLYHRVQETLAEITRKPPPEEQPGAAPAEPPPPAPEEQAAPPAPEPVVQVDLGVISLTIPAGWQRVPAVEEGSEKVKLFLLGPEVAGGQAGFTVTIEPLEEGTALADFATSLIEQWPQAAVGESKSVKLGEISARYVSFAAGGKVFINYCFLHQGQGIILTAVVSPQAADEAQGLLAPILDSVHLQPGLAE